MLRFCLGLLSRTWRLTHIRHGSIEEGPSVRVLWHGHQLPFIARLKGKGLTVLVSHSEDGQLLTDCLLPFGYQVIRGSSSRGGAEALEAFEACVAAGGQAVFAVDGPRGPRHRAHTGAARLSQATGACIIPMAMAARSAWTLRSWDHFQIPLPFSRVVLVEGAPIGPGGEDILGLTAKLSDGIHRCEEFARLHLGKAMPLYYRLTLFSLQLLLLLVLPLLLPILLLRKRWRIGLLERFGGGRVPKKSKALALKAPEGTSASPGIRVQFHGASLGESQLAAGIAEGLASRFSCHLTVTSPEAWALQGQNPTWQSVRMAALDLPFMVSRHFKGLKPHILVVIEGEIWPWHWWRARQLGIPIIWLNARFSHRSASRWSSWAQIAQNLGPGVALFYPRNVVDGARIETLFPVERAKGRALELKALKRGESITHPDLVGWCRGPVWIAGSCHENEFQLLLEAHVEARKTIPDLKLILAPRRLKAIAQAEALAEGLGLSPILRTRMPKNAIHPSLLILDTFGELSDLYAHAQVAFVGGTLGGQGGHNPFEALSHGCPILLGPHRQNIDGDLAAITPGWKRHIEDLPSLTQALLSYFDAGKPQLKGDNISLMAFSKELEAAMVDLKLPTFD